MRATSEGKCDLGRIARPIKDKEKKYNLNYRVFAISPVVFVFNRNIKSLDNLSAEQIVGIYSGLITRWSELGLGDKKIYVANREKGDSSRSALEEKLPGFSDIQEFAGQVIYNTPETISTISQFRDTIGYGPLSMVQGTDIYIAKVDGMYPSPENVRKGEYNLKTPFAIVWKGKLSGSAKRFVEYLFSSDAQKIILNNGAVAVGR